MRSKLIPLAILVLSSLAICQEFLKVYTKRPFYVIGHMSNSPRLINFYLGQGCNALQTDVQFLTDGSLQLIHHSGPCDSYHWYCDDAMAASDYFDYIQELTDPSTKKRVQNNLSLLLLNLKLKESFNLTRSGEDTAVHLLQYLWSGGRSKVKVVLYIESELKADFITAVIDEFVRLELGDRIYDVGFDLSVGSWKFQRAMVENLNSRGYFFNVWLGNGIHDPEPNPFTKVPTVIIPAYDILKSALTARDTLPTPIDKVYMRTIGKTTYIREVLHFHVDGMITSNPLTVLEVLQEPEFVDLYRMATIEDNPFVRFYKTVIEDIPDKVPIGPGDFDPESAPHEQFNHDEFTHEVFHYKQLPTEIPAEENPIEDVTPEEIEQEEIPIEEVSPEDIPAEEITPEDIPIEEVSPEEIPIEVVSHEKIEHEDISHEEIPTVILYEDIPTEVPTAIPTEIPTEIPYEEIPEPLPTPVE